MNDANMIQLVVGTICAGATGISVAFVVYWNVFAKKHLASLFAQEQKPAAYTRRPAFQLAPAQFQQN